MGESVSSVSLETDRPMIGINVVNHRVCPMPGPHFSKASLSNLCSHSEAKEGKDTQSSNPATVSKDDDPDS